MRGMERRRNWRVASLIISTNSGLSATAGSLAKASSQGASLRPALNEPFPERLDV